MMVATQQQVETAAPLMESLNGINRKEHLKMSSLNKPIKPNLTLEGGKAGHCTDEQALRRAVLSTLLWEKQFYEEGVDIVERIAALIPKVKPEEVHLLARKARGDYKLRHVPLLLAVECLKHSTHKKGLSEVITDIIQRPDELCEILAVYAERNKGNRSGDKLLDNIANQLRKGVAGAFNKFNEYSLAKYDQDQKSIKLRDVLQLVHPKPKSTIQSELFKKVLDKTLTTPDTWEVALSAGGPTADKKALWTRLLVDRKLGALALIRNLRNMQQAGVEIRLIKEALEEAKVDRVLPFRFIAAATHAPQLESSLESMMFKCLEGMTRLPGTTALIVDASGSMFGTKVSAKSDMDRFDAACALAILVREVCQEANVYAFHNEAFVIPNRRGFALRDAMRAVGQGNSRGGLAVERANKDGYDRIIVLTDGEWHPMAGGLTALQQLYYHRDTYSRLDPKTCPPPLPNTHRYMINVAAQRQGVSYSDWTNIEGWSEAVLEYISAIEGGV